MNPTGIGITNPSSMSWVTRFMTWVLCSSDSADIRFFVDFTNGVVDTFEVVLLEMLVGWVVLT